MKVLQIGKFYPPYMGGIETHLQVLCKTIAPFADVQVVVASNSSKSSHETIDGVPVTRLSNLGRPKGLVFCPSLLNSIRKIKPDLAHIHLPNPVGAAALLASGFAGPIVTTYHSDIVRQRVLGALLEPITNRLLRRSSAILVTSPNYLESSRILAYFKSKCCVIPYGIEARLFQSFDAGEVQDIRRRYGDRLVLAAGRLVYYKGFEYLIAAMKSVRGTLAIIGDGPLKASLLRHCENSGAKDKIAFVGEIPNHKIAPYLHAARVFALPSVERSEAFGIVQLEAMACAKPVINTTLDSGVPFVSRHNETGLSVPPRDAQSLARALNQLLDDQGLAASMGKLGMQRVARDFTAETMATNTLAVYRKAIGASSGPPLADSIKALHGNMNA